MELSHVDSSGKATMVDISAKKPVKRTAVAQARISLREETIDLLRQGLLKKGDALACARIAGVAGGKRTSDLIPLCHNISIEHIGVDFEIQQKSILITSRATCTSKTGIEMEALTAVSVAALTIYDMCKAVDKEMVISDVRLTEKRKETLA